MVKRENYENMEESVETQACKNFRSKLGGDSKTKGINDIYKNITGKDSTLDPSSIDCKSPEQLRNIQSKTIDMITEMSFNALDNKDTEKGNNDLVSLFLLLAALSGNSNEIKETLDSNGNIDTIEINRITPAIFVKNFKNSGEVPLSSPPPEIAEKLNKAKNLAKTKVKVGELDKFENDNNPKMKVSTLATLLSHKLSKDGMIIN